MGKRLGLLPWLIILPVRLICELIRCGKRVNLRFGAAFWMCFHPDKQHQRGLISLVMMLKRSAALIRLPSAALASSKALILRPVAEFMMNEATIAQFRTGYLSLFGAKASRDALYESVSAGRSHPGIEHWLPLFHGNLACLTDYCSGWPIVLDHESDAAVAARYAQIHDFHEARLAHGSDDTASPYRPLAPEKLYLSQTETDQLFEQGKACRLFAFAPMPGGTQDGGQDGAQDSAKPDQAAAQDAGGRAAIRLDQS